MVGFTMAGVCMAVFACVACVFMLCLRVRPVRWGSRAGAVWRTLSCVFMLCLHVWPVCAVWPCGGVCARKGGARGGPPPLWCAGGGVLLSHTLAGAVPSALAVLASGFGKGKVRACPCRCGRRHACRA